MRKWHSHDYVCNYIYNLLASFPSHVLREIDLLILFLVNLCLSTQYFRLSKIIIMLKI